MPYSDVLGRRSHSVYPAKDYTATQSRRPRHEASSPRNLKSCKCGLMHILSYLRRCIQKFPGWVHNEINNSSNKHSSRSNTKGYGNKIHQTDSQNSDTTAPSGRELYICSSRSRRPVRILLDTPSYITGKFCAPHPQETIPGAEYLIGPTE
jgi:hypothetical protein